MVPSDASGPKSGRPSEGLSYQKAGVDPDKAAQILGDFASYLKTRPRPTALLSGIGPFASCYSLKDLIAKMPDPILVTCCDGVGTKALLALQWGDISGLGQDLVAMNVNDLLCAGALPLQFLDYYACGKLEETQLTTLLKSIQRACEDSGCALVGGETAEMPGLYDAPEFDLAGFAVGLCDRAQLLGPSKVQAGDKLIALPSTGFHSNGYSLVRKIVEQEKLQPQEKPAFAGGSTWKQLLLAPTQLYVKMLQPVLGELNALAHITGGGLYENLPRVLPENLAAHIDASAWAMPELFTYFQKAARLSTTQVLSTFNCGVGMILVSSPTRADKVIGTLRQAGAQPRVIGEVRKAEGTARVVWTDAAAPKS